jgi:hypothetical protein
MSVTGVPAGNAPALTVNRPFRPVVTGARVYDPKRVRFDLQALDDNCLQTVARWFAKRAGINVPSQVEWVRRAINFGRNMNASLGAKLGDMRAYIAGSGSPVAGTTRMLRVMGAEVKDATTLGKPLGVADMKTALAHGYDVSAVVSGTTPKGNKFSHAVAVIEITNGQVVYGDPWTGFFWTVDECAFDDALVKQWTLFSKWKPAGGKP